jgi:hypothetical protein
VPGNSRNVALEGGGRRVGGFVIQACDHADQPVDDVREVVDSLLQFLGALS